MGYHGTSVYRKVFHNIGHGDIINIMYMKKNESYNMQTILMDMTAGPDEALIARAGAILKAGGLVAFPTETVYGLGGNALDADASRKIYAAKGRPSDNPLIVHIARLDALYPLIAETDIPAAVSKEVLALAEAFWPGPLTMILPKSDLVPRETTGGLATVAVRMPAHPVALALIEAAGGYIAAPSANVSGRPSPTTAAHVIEDLDGRIDVIIDGGDVGIGLESTIIDLTEEVPVILRPGYISLKMLKEVIGEVRMDRGLTVDDPNIRPKAPGMKYRHYAPSADMKIVEGKPEEVIRAINILAERAAGEGLKAGIIATDESRGNYHTGIVKSVGSRKEEITIAMHLYGILREFDQTGVNVIYSEAFDTPQMGQAIMNRLIKAAAHQVIRAAEINRER